jgi:hypothetical protein
MIGKTIVVWFSCGAASAVAAKLTIDKYGEKNQILVVNNPVSEEDEDNKRFLLDIEKWLGVKIQISTNKNFPNCSAEEVWQKKKFMSGTKGAPCTLELKKKARQQWEAQNHFDYLVLGFTYEEQNRFLRFKMTERDNILPVLIEEKITKNDCFKIIENAEIKLPRVYLKGFPNANCLGCVKASSPTYWNHLRLTYPDVFNKRANLSRTLNARLVRYKGNRIFLDELPTEAVGRSMNSYKIDCGIFCEEGKD